MGIDVATIDHDHFVVHLDHGNLVVTRGTIEEATQIPSSPQHAALLPLIDYMTLMGIRCTKLDHGVQANTTFRIIHCVGRWIQHNILGIDHTTSFYRPALQIIHSRMTRQHNVCVNTMLLQQLIANSQRTRDVKYSLPVLVTRLCRNFLPDVEFVEYDRVLVTPERITSVYNSCLHSIWIPTVQLEDVPIEFSSEEQMDTEDEPQFW